VLSSSKFLEQENQVCSLFFLHQFLHSHTFVPESFTFSGRRREWMGLDSNSYEAKASIIDSFLSYIHDEPKNYVQFQNSPPRPVSHPAHINEEENHRQKGPKDVHFPIIDRD
jgi:hypothetical protein